MKKRKGLRDGTYRHIEDIIRTYYKYPQWIKQREEQLVYPYREDDVSGGGGSLPSSPTEITALNLTLDNELRQLKREYRLLKELMKSTDEDTEKIIKFWYLKRPSAKSWDGISAELELSKRQCFRLRDDFIKELAKKLGFI